MGASHWLAWSPAAVWIVPSVRCVQHARTFSATTKPGAAATIVRFIAARHRRRTLVSAARVHCKKCHCNGPTPSRPLHCNTWPQPHVSVPACTPPPNPGVWKYEPNAPHTRAARSATTPDDGSAAAATAATSPAATAARQTATAATASQLRRQALERTNEQKGKRRRQHDDDDPDGATSESPTLAEIDSACADHDASTASAALPRAEGDHGRTSGSDGGYGRTAEAAANGGRVLPAHDATQSRRPRRRRPTATGCPAADPDDHS